MNGSNKHQCNTLCMECYYFFFLYLFIIFLLFLVIYLAKHERLGWLGNRLFCFMNNLVVNRAFTLYTGGISFNFELYLNIFRDSLSAQSQWKYFCMEIYQFVSEIFSIGLIFITPSYFGKEVDGLVLRCDGVFW